MLQLPEVDRDSPVPPYRQVAASLIEGIRRGDWQPEERLPSVADLVQATGIARRTAAKALRVVADAGFAELSDGMGYYALAQPPDETAMRPDGGEPPRTGPDDTGR